MSVTFSLSKHQINPTNLTHLSPFCVFQTKPATDSRPSLPSIPRENQPLITRQRCYLCDLRRAVCEPVLPGTLPERPMTLPMPHPELAERWPLWSTLDNHGDKINKFACIGPLWNSLGIHEQPSEE